jgi:hypothetical protein
LRVLCIYQLMLLHECRTIPVPSSGRVYIFQSARAEGGGGMEWKTRGQIDGKKGAKFYCKVWHHRVSYDSIIGASEGLDKNIS